MKNQKGNVMMIVLVVVVLLLIAAGAYYFTTLQQKNQETAVYTPTTAQDKTSTPVKATPDPNDLTIQLDSVQMEDTDSSFSAVDQDLKNL